MAGVNSNMGPPSMAVNLCPSSWNSMIGLPSAGPVGIFKTFVIVELGKMET